MAASLSSVRAATKLAPGVTELREYPRPPLGDDDGLLRVAAAGICGADIKWYRQEDEAPRILGHEIVGWIDSVTASAARRWGVSEGQLVALEEYLPCGSCSWCRVGEYRHCWAADPTASANLRFGSTPITVPPALWGGYAELVYLPPNAIVHHIPAGIPPVRAAFALPLGNGFQWTYLDGKVGPGSAVLIQGPGQQGLGCVIAAREAGANLVIVSGTRSNAWRLEIARALGATTINVDEQDLVATVQDLTGGLGVDVSIDTSGGSAVTAVAALKALKRKEGIAVLQPAEVPSFPLDIINRKAITIRMTRGHSYRAVGLALELLATDRYPFELLNSHTFDLDGVDTAIRTARGHEFGPSMHVVVTPGSPATRAGHLPALGVSDDASVQERA
jgi:threonine dehydrogenase-like Zn-dependent dehydrogenase